MKIIKFICIFIMIIVCQSAFADNLDIMISQKILVGIGEKGEFKKVLRLAENHKITGVILFERDIKSSFDLLDKTKQLKKVVGIPLFIAVDQEGGYVQRLNSKNGFKDYKTAKEISKGTYEGAYSQYKLMAQDLSFYGFNMNFAPCVDLIINEDSIINKKERAYSSNPDVVILYAQKALDAYKENKIITSLKHYPGHGSAVGDTHLGFVDVTDTWSEDELIPYKKLANRNNLQTVMAAHVFNRNFDDEYPASLSKNTIASLREYFDGVVITDDLDMKAIKDNYSLEETIINAINADVDILLFSNYTETVSVNDIYKIIKNAIKEGKISKEQIHKSYDRIIKLKKALYTYGPYEFDE